MTPDQNEMRFTPVQAFEAKASAQGVVEGLASTFGGMPDSYGDIIERGAFAATLARHRDERSMPAFLWSHDHSKVVGSWTDLRETAEGLEVRGQLNLATTAGKDAFAHLRAGDISAFSIGFRARKSRMEKSARVLTEIDLHEVSLVALPANRAARVRQVKSAALHIESRAALRDLLVEGGLPRGAAEKVATLGWPALASPETQFADLLPELRALAALFTKGN
jgi:HK97 family phage prohead protease